jgi:dihydropteroate synthase
MVERIANRPHDLPLARSPVPMLLRCGKRTLDLRTPVVMGVLNVTPDSFSDGGHWFEPDAAIARGIEMVQQGAGIIDVGGESTRPGATPVSEDEELQRVVPIVAALASKIHVPISVDTSRANVIKAACAAGATFINDVRALSEPDAMAAAAASSSAVCVMHMQGRPNTMQVLPAYDNVVEEVHSFLTERIKACREAGIAADRIAVDPGIGFGKSLEHNLSLLAYIDRFRNLNCPLLVGVSRKSLIGKITGRDVNDRLAGSIAFATAAVLAGASIIRAHDIRETVDAVRVAAALRMSRQAGEKL